MRDKNIFSVSRAFPRMSWSLRNLYLINLRSTDEKLIPNFTKTDKPLFKQRWLAKQLVRAYHGDFISEKIFKRWYLPETLPDLRSRKKISNEETTLPRWAGRQEVVDRLEQKEEDDSAMAALSPVGSLMFIEVERRIDVFVFRCCFSPSVYDARRLVIHGHVKLNGKVHRNAGTRLAPGDMVSVDPAHISFLRDHSGLNTNSNEEHDNKPQDENDDANNDSVVPANTENDTEVAADNPVEGAEETNEKEGEIQEATVASESEAEPREEVENYKGQPWTRNRKLTPFVLPPYASPFIFIPAYIEPSFATCSAVYVRHPTARPGYSEIPTPYDADGEVVRLAWEWYAKQRPRTRSRSQLARMPNNRTNHSS